MADSISTITGKVKLRTPTQAEALSSRYTFLNLQNAEPNLGIPTPPGILNEYPGDPGIRYALLSNNNNGLSSWRVWSYDNPKIAAYSIENSLGLGNNSNPVNTNSLVYSNYTYSQNNIYNSQSFSDFSFNVFAISGIYLFDATTIGDPLCATAFIVTEGGLVGIGTENPTAPLTVQGNISANGSFFLTDNANLGNTKNDTHTLRGTVRLADSFSAPLLFGNNNTGYDVNLYRTQANTLRTDDDFVCSSVSAVNALTGTEIKLTNSPTVSSTSVSLTASEEFLSININGKTRAIRLWDY